MFDGRDLDPDDFDFSDQSDMVDELDQWLSDPDFFDLDFSDYYNDGEPPELMLDVPYVPTDTRTVDAILELARVGHDDFIYDLGCGDGRIVVTAALERGARGIGIDMDPMRIADAMELAGNSMVEHMTDFIEGDLLQADFSDATVVTLYLLDLLNLELRPRLLDELRPGTRIISHAFDMGDWKPDEHVRLGHVNLYKWLIPAKIAGSWQWQSENGDHYRVNLEQKFQEISGHAWINDEKARLHRARLHGDLVEFGIKPRKEGKAHNFVMRWKKDGQLHPEGKHGQAGPATRC